MQVTSQGPSVGLHIYSTSKDSSLIALLLIDCYAYFARVYIALKMGEGGVGFFSPFSPFMSMVVFRGETDMAGKSEAAGDV